MTQSQKVILAGGNGYIGGATAYALQDAGFTPVILDNFSTSKKGALSAFALIETDLTDLDHTRRIVKSLGSVIAVFHFAAKALVPESFKVPDEYFKNNLGASTTVAELSKEFHIPFVIHSSSCAVYGNPDQVPITEQSPLRATSPYGETKILAESLFKKFHEEKIFRVLNLRYFNPAGAFLTHAWGEGHDPETHLIPNVVKSAMTQTPVNLFGNQYPTFDGSCVRDFIHIEDLAHAHVLALQTLLSKKELPLALNIGSGQGHSVLEVIHTAERITGKKIEILTKPNRPGDPAKLVADNKAMFRIFNWTPQRTLDQMIKDDWTWRSSIVK